MVQSGGPRRQGGGTEEAVVERPPPAVEGVPVLPRAQNGGTLSGDCVTAVGPGLVAGFEEEEVIGRSIAVGIDVQDQIGRLASVEGGAVRPVVQRREPAQRDAGIPGV